MMKRIFFVSGLMIGLISFPIISLAQSVKIQINVVCPPDTPKDAVVYIVGGREDLGNWNPGLIPMMKVDDSTRSFTFSCPAGMLTEFKITRGRWSNEAIYQKGVISPNWRVHPDQDTVITLYPISWLEEKGPPPNFQITGTVKYHKQLMVKGLAYKRDVIVWFPPGYEKEKKRRYPVLYMHDGQNVIDPMTSFTGTDWQADEVADSLIRQKKIESIIIVGIYNSPDRVEEYSDTPKGRAYATWVANVLKPMIDKTYRTKKDRKNTAVMGSSMGGLISFLFVWWYPNVFYQAGCMSPAFIVHDFQSVKEVKAAKKMKDVRIYMDNGTVELEDTLQRGLDQMKPALEAKGYVLGKNLDYFIDQGAAHNEAAWAKRLPRPMIFMFGKNK
jgi:predicted alpha/beta superfamily hydrolase